MDNLVKKDSDRKKLEFNVKLSIKDIPIDEYEAIMKPYKRLMLAWEKTLRVLADDNKIAYKLLDKISDVFKFDEIHYMKFQTPEEDELTLTAPKPMYTSPPGSGINPMFQTPPPPAFATPSYPSPQPFQSPIPPPTEPPATYYQNQPPQQVGSAPAPRVSTRQTYTQPGVTPTGYSETPAPSGYNSGIFQQEPKNAPTLRESLGNLRDIVSDDTSTKSSPRPIGMTPTETVKTPNFGLSPSTQQPISSSSPTKSSTSGFAFNVPSISPESATAKDSSVNIGADEEDLATGIAILRRKMLQELRKIRSVVEEQGQDDSF